MQISDAFVTILFTLFVASTVNERIIDFIKLRRPVLCLKLVNHREEMKRHQRLWLLAFGMGIITATLVDINLLVFLIENYSGAKLTGLLKPLLESRFAWIATAFGYLFTALFLSLGSKFWHDLLDLVLFVKNSKRKMEDFNPVGVTDMKQVMEYYHADEYELACKALEANRRTLESQHPNSSFNIGCEHINGEYRWSILIMNRNQTAGDEKRKGSEKINYVSNNGYVFSFPLINFPVGQIETTENKPDVIAGKGLFNQDNPNSIGTFGCIVKDLRKGCDNYLLLTCYHCVRIPNEHDWEGIDIKAKKRSVRYIRNKQDNQRKLIGDVIVGYRDGRMDIAIIKPKSNDLVSDYINNSNQTIPIGHRKVTKEDVEKKTRLWFSGATTGAGEGFIISFGHTDFIHYHGDKDPHKLRNLIVFSQTQAEPYTKPCDKGDSGAIIIEADTNKALGMVVARDSKFGYAIPIADILELNYLALFTDPCETITT